MINHNLFLNIKFSRNLFLNIFYFLMVASFAIVFLKIVTVGLQHGIPFSKEGFFGHHLINYKGGFFRRGLIGELLLTVCKTFNLKPYPIIVSINALTYIIFIVFFVKSFIKNGYSIFILPFTFFLVFPMSSWIWIARNDVLLILNFILIIYILIKGDQGILTNIFLITGTLIHEVSFFFTFPIVFFIFLERGGFGKNNLYSKSIIVSILKLFPSIFTFLYIAYVSMTKASETLAIQIWLSWKDILFLNSNDVKIPDGISIVAGESFIQGVPFFEKQDGVYKFLIAFPIFFAIYLILININRLDFQIFKYKPSANIDKNIFSCILLFQTLAILPLYFIALDIWRWTYFIYMTSFAVILLIPNDYLLKVIPSFLFSAAKKINHTIDKFIIPSKDFLILLCLIIGMGAGANMFQYQKTTFMYFLQCISIIMSFFIKMFFSLIG